MEEETSEEASEYGGENVGAKLEYIGVVYKVSLLVVSRRYTAQLTSSSRIEPYDAAGTEAATYLVSEYVAYGNMHISWWFCIYWPSTGPRCRACMTASTKHGECHEQNPSICLFPSMWRMGVCM